MTDTNSVLAKIKKLQSLTVERGATPEEAATAAAKAQALLFEHNLSMADLDTHEQAADPYGRVEATLDGANRSTVQWRRSLLYTVAKHNWCSAITLPNSTTMQVVGRRSNVETVLYLNSILVREIERLALEAGKTVLNNRAAYMVSFCRGAVSTIHARLAEQQRQQTQQATSTTNTRSTQNAVILRSAADELNKAVAHFYPSGLRTTPVRSRIRSADGYYAGKAAGVGISMHRGVSQGRPSALIG